MVFANVRGGMIRLAIQPIKLQQTMATTPTPKRLAFFERYLTVWVLVCMVVGVAFGKLLPGVTSALSKLEFGQGSQVNVPIGILLWLMIYPMMLKVDFSAIGGIAKRPKGLMVTLIVNFLVKPFSMAFLAWLFMQHIFAHWIDGRVGEEDGLKGALANDRRSLAPLGNRTCRFPASGSYDNSRSTGGSQVAFEVDQAQCLQVLVEGLSLGNSIGPLALVAQV